MRTHRPIEPARPQRGAVLIVSLLLLLVMTLLGLGMSQSTRMQERMAGNQRDMELAMQGAEAGLRASESMLSQRVPDEKVFQDACDNAAVQPPPDCFTFADLFYFDTVRTAPLDLAKQTDDWWDKYAKEYATTPKSLSRPPQYVNEYYEESRDVLSNGGSYIKSIRDFYRVTARSSGMTDTSQVVVQGSYARIAFE